MSNEINDLLTILDDLGEDIEECLIQAVLEGTQKIQADAKRLCKVDTGQLRNSIVASASVENGEIVGTISSNSDHAMAVEFGTGPVGAASPKFLPKKVTLTYRNTGWVYKNPKASGKNDQFIYTKGQPAKPFMYPAFIQNKSNVERIIISSLKQKVKEL